MAIMLNFLLPFGLITVTNEPFELGVKCGTHSRNIPVNWIWNCLRLNS